MDKPIVMTLCPVCAKPFYESDEHCIKRADMKIDNTYAAIMLIEILYDRGIVNEATYKNVVMKYKSQCEEADSHISQMAS